MALPTAISLCGGGGDAEYGIKKHLQTVFVVDIDEKALETHRRNHPGIPTICGDIADAEILRQARERVRNVDVIIAAPPCQDFAPCHSATAAERISSGRSALYLRAIDWVAAYMPLVYVAENVPAVRKSWQFNAAIARLRRLGYRVTLFDLDAADFGTAQHRERLFVIAVRGSVPLPQRPAFTHGDAEMRTKDSSLKPYVTLKNAIYDLFELELAAIAKGPEAHERFLTEDMLGVLKLSAKRAFYLSYVPPGGSWKDLPPEILAMLLDDLQKKGKAPYEGLAARFAWLTVPGTLRTSPSIIHWSMPIHPGVDDRTLRMVLHDFDRPEWTSPSRTLTGNPCTRKLMIPPGVNADNAEALQRAGFWMRRPSWSCTSYALTSNPDGDKSVLIGPGYHGDSVDLSAGQTFGPPCKALVGFPSQAATTTITPIVTRYLTVREFARIMGLPDSFTPVGSIAARYRAIGNGIPPQLMGAVCGSVAKALAVADSFGSMAYPTPQTKLTTPPTSDDDNSSIDESASQPKDNDGPKNGEEFPIVQTLGSAGNVVPPHAEQPQPAPIVENRQTEVANDTAPIKVSPPVNGTTGIVPADSISSENHGPITAPLALTLERDTATTSEPDTSRETAATLDGGRPPAVEVAISGSTESPENASSALPHGKGPFSHIFDRDAQIAIVESATNAAKESKFANRFHCVLYGPPASAKTEILRTFKRLLGPDQVLELDATSTTKAGAERMLLEIADLPPFLIIEEIEKTDEGALRWLLGVLDDRGEIRKTTANAGSVTRSVRMLCLATANDIDRFNSVLSGSLASRFVHKIYCPRPSRKILNQILEREIVKVGGNPAWIRPALQYCLEVERTDDPRRVIAVCLSGRDALLTGEFQRHLQRTRSMPLQGKQKWTGSDNAAVCKPPPCNSAFSPACDPVVSGLNGGPVFETPAACQAGRYSLLCADPAIRSASGDEARQSVKRPRLRSLLKWVGGKYRFLRHILPLVEPDGRTSTYVEPFAGSAVVLLNKSPHASEVLNDADHDLVNLLSVLQDQKLALALKRRLELTPISRSVFMEALDSRPTDPVDRAVNLVIRTRQSICSVATSRTARDWAIMRKSAGKLNGLVSAWRSLSDLVIPLQNRLLRTVIDSQDGIRCIQQWDSEKTLFYVDPPYIDCETYYNVKFSGVEHERLADALNAIRGRAVVSYYDHPVIHRLYPESRWNVQRIQTTSLLSRCPRTELLLVKKRL